MASTTFPSVPPILKPLQSFMKIASDFEKLDAVIAYWVRFYVVQNGLKIDSKSKESIGFLTAIMSWLEKEKKLRHDNEAITNDITGEAHLENYALQLFSRADNDDREGKANKNTSRLFLISSHLFEVLSVFGEIDEDIKRRIKYAKWKAIYISKCLKNGETPIPGPVGGIDDEDLELYNFQPSNTNTENTTNSFDNVNNKSEKVVPDSEPISSPSNVSSSATNQSSLTAINGKPLAAEDLVKAQKLCKFAGSALQYEDIPTAITNLQKALSLLTTGNENI